MRSYPGRCCRRNIPSTGDCHSTQMMFTFTHPYEMQINNKMATVTKPENEPILRMNAKKSKPKSESPPSVDMAQQILWMSTNKWKIMFLSTLTHTLYISERPFEHFRICSPEFLETTQKVFDLVFPEIVYQLSPNDAIVKMVPSLFLFMAI